MKQKIFIRSWNGFNLNDSKIKKHNFPLYYSSYYSFQKNNKKGPLSYWVSNKSKISNELATILNPFKKILSVGCGTAIIEKGLLQQLPKDIFIHGIDPYIIKDQEMISSNLKIEKKSIFEINSAKYDIVYMNTVDYCLNDKEYKEIVSKNLELSENGLLLSQIYIPDLNYLTSLKYKISTFYKSLPITPYVFWGWLRTLDEHLSLLKQSGYSSFNIGEHSNGSFWIHAK